MLAPAPSPPRWPVLLPTLAVAGCAVAATAHGGYEVAAASGVPPVIAALYPLITDGLALVAYAATHRLVGRVARGYAWTVVVAAAGLSGLAQAVLLASPALEPPQVVRFGVGYWPAIAGAVAAHLVYLLVARKHRNSHVGHGSARTVADEIAARTAHTPRLADTETSRPGPTPIPPATPDGTPHVEPVRPLRLAPTPDAPTPPEGVPAGRAAELIAAGAGRKTLARELDISEHEARQLLAKARA